MDAGGGALGVPPLPRGEDNEPRSLRREGNILYAKVPGGANEVPYVKVDGVWKVSVRDVLITALRAQLRAGRRVRGSRPFRAGR